ncbi:hypothetical protein Avbf_06220 [Armadillidium vulgare]|nr:hypothetical protein Avbf_06220 [Armadillidium vulgare]
MHHSQNNKIFDTKSDNNDEESERQLPYFIEPIPNKTVVVGRDVILPCAVDNLKGFKVAWIFVETQTILTIHHTIITKNPRFSLARHDHKTLVFADIGCEAI